MSAAAAAGRPTACTPVHAVIARQFLHRRDDWVGVSSLGGSVAAAAAGVALAIAAAAPAAVTAAFACAERLQADAAVPFWLVGRGDEVLQPPLQLSACGL